MQHKDLPEGAGDTPALDRLFLLLDYFCAGAVQVRLADSAYTPEAVWEYMTAHGYTADTFALLGEAASFSKGVSHFLLFGGGESMPVLADAYTSVRTFERSLIATMDAITKNRDTMLKLLVDGGFYELA